MKLRLYTIIFIQTIHTESGSILSTFSSSACFNCSSNCFLSWSSRWEWPETRAELRLHSSSCRCVGQHTEGGMDDGRGGQEGGREQESKRGRGTHTVIKEAQFYQFLLQLVLLVHQLIDTFLILCLDHLIRTINTNTNTNTNTSYMS